MMCICSRGLKLGQKCSATHAECEFLSQTHIDIYIYIYRERNANTTFQMFFKALIILCSSSIFCVLVVCISISIIRISIIRSAFLAYFQLAGASNSLPGRKSKKRHKKHTQQLMGLCVYVCVYMCMCVCVYVHVYICVYIYMCICVCVCVYVYVCVCVCMCVDVCILCVCIM
jgi:hypothetical protein